MTETSSPKRPHCPTCLRAQQACICRWIAPTANVPEVLVLQHPLEVHQAKGSARLLHLSLLRSRLAVGEVFEEHGLESLLTAPCARAGSALESVGIGDAYPVLLYPETPDYQALGLRVPPSLDTARLADAGNIRLVVLDGTWRKSRKMLYANSLLQALPRLPLHDMPVSKYRIRKAQGAHQLSTLEAACYALMQLEGSEAKYQPLLESFDGFVAQQLEYRTIHAVHATPEDQ
jgi:DTW domain-containing protein